MIENLKLAVESGWKVLTISLLLGAGVPAMFALGIRALAIGGRTKEADVARPIGRALSVLCFATVAAAVIVGITYIVASGFGKTLSFHEFYPTFVDK